MQAHNIIFSSVLISFFIHATEDAERLCKAVRDEFRLAADEIELDSSLEGHHGNKVLFVKSHLTAARASDVSAIIFERLSKESKQTLKDSIASAIDEHDCLYLRIDRQRLDDHVLYFSQEEPIRIKLKPKTRLGRSAMMDAYLELLRQ